ncbi:hypothetical protein [Methanobrevibacter curvatus]|nr:hypothetical protein [Methanobrevibacter curvatus]
MNAVEYNELLSKFISNLKLTVQNFKVIEEVTGIIGNAETI